MLFTSGKKLMILNFLHFISYRTIEKADDSSMLSKVKKLIRSNDKIIRKRRRGDVSFLQEIMRHANPQQECEICLKHSPSSSSSLRILHEISISSGSKSNAPTKIRINLVGRYLQPSEYVLQDSLVNRYPYWQNAELGYVLWYNNVVDCWVISQGKDIGTSKWIFAGPIGSNKWPNEIFFKGKVLIQDIYHLTEQLIKRYFVQADPFNNSL